MRRVFGLGESLLDIIFKDETPISAKPGGSVLNALISLSRMNCNTFLITELGTDTVGNIITKFLKENGINTNYTYRHQDGSSTLALAFLNEKNDANYQFYKNAPKERFKINNPKLTSQDIFLFGSTLAISSNVRNAISKIINNAASNDATIVYDPNCRKDHSSDPTVRNYIEENFANATIVRCSDEDLKNIYGEIAISEAIKKVKSLCKNVIVTQNSKNVIFDFELLTKDYRVKELNPISTVGAGDSFNAGIIYSLIKSKITSSNINCINEDQMNDIAEYGIEFSSEVCESTDNYISIKQ